MVDVELGRMVRACHRNSCLYMSSLEINETEVNGR